MTTTSSLVGCSRQAALLPCLLLLACQTAVPVSPAQGTPALAAIPSTPSGAAAGASHDPRGLAAHDECPKPVWADGLRLQPSGVVGSVLLGALGLSVSDEAGKAPNKRLNGAPAVVVEQAAAGYRLIGADGTIGWASSPSGSFVAAGVTFEDPNTELFSVLFTPPSASPPDLETTAVGAGFATIIGASPRAVAESMWQLGAGVWNQSVTLPWLRVKSSNVTGWLPPSTTSVVWQVAETQRCNPFANLHGLVRGSRLARAKRALAEWAPKAGAVLQPLATPGAPPLQITAPCAADAAIFSRESEPPTLVQFNCGGSPVFAYSNVGERAYFALNDDRTDIGRYAFVDVFGDAKPELVLELGLSWSHDYVTTLLILPSKANAKALGLFPLSGLEADTDASWSLSTTAREVNVSRTSGRKIQAIRLVDRNTAKLAPHTANASDEEPQSTQHSFVEQPGFLALFSQHKTLSDAERQALGDPGAMVLSLSTKSPESYATGNVFASQTEACTALAAHRTTPAVRALAANRPCQGVSHKK